MTAPRDRATLHRALRAYIAGHDRGWTVGRKRETGGSDREEAASPTFDELAGRSESHIGIPVPERLDFHRGPDTWRSREREAADESGSE